MKKAVVFGGSGFLGSYVVDELNERGFDVVIFDRQPSHFHPRGQVIIGDILDSQAVNQAVEGASFVYNFAGVADLNYSIDKPLQTIQLNVMGNLQILEACVQHRVKRFVFASSAYVFSRKGAFYGVSKKSSELIIEQYAEQFGLDYTIIRYGSVYGERADHTNRIYRIIKQALLERRIAFDGDGSEEREYIHGRDAARLSVDILEEKYRNQNVLLTGVERMSYRDLLLFIREIFNDRIAVEFNNLDYKGHYSRTPYSFSPTIGVKLVNNPCVDFGQGVLECIEKIHHDLIADGQLSEAENE